MNMAAKDKASAAAAAARKAGENPYLQRTIQDEELRDNMVVAFEAAKKVLVEDKKLHKDLKRSADALRDATSALRDAPKHSKPKSKRKGGIGRILLVAVLGGAVAVAVSDSLRGKLLDALFGAEEEFDYTSSTAPTSPPPET